MRALFISRGNSNGEISTIVGDQGESLSQFGIDIEYFIITGKGFFGYLRCIPKLRQKETKKDYDLIHAHYSLSAIAASFCRTRPLIVSLMGSDVFGIRFSRVLVKIFNHFLWTRCIVKSKNMAQHLRIKDLHIIPNGVDLDLFKPEDRDKACEKLGWNEKKIHLLFPANPARKEKNIQLLYDCLALLRENSNIELHFLQNIPHIQTYLHYNASDIMVLTSLWEGSPNVVKEAMSCNCPIISTNVGDVDWIIGDTSGCSIVKPDAVSLASAIDRAILFGKRTNGRSRIESLDLDKDSIASQLILLYNNLL